MSVGGSIRAAELCHANMVSPIIPQAERIMDRRDRASGFCYFNDPVFAILTLLDLADIETCCSIVDLSMHTMVMAWRMRLRPTRTRLLTLSIHEAERWPYTGTLDDRGQGKGTQPAGARGAQRQRSSGR